MFKGTNKLWKGLALVLALCMISTVAYAEGESDPNNAVITLTTTTYDNATQTATIAGTISKAGNDVTILAVREAQAYDELDEEVWTTTKLQEKVVYIDQIESAADTGAFSFSFIPRGGVTGGVISVFVGGEEVAEIKTADFEAKVTAPELVLPEKWYEGETSLTINLMKQSNTEAAYEGAEEWASKISSITFTPAKSDIVKAYADGKLTLSGFAATGETLTKIVIATTDGEYTDAVWEDELAQEKKDAGSLSFTGTAVAGGDAQITVTSADEDWLEDIETSVFVGDATEAAVGVTYEAGTLYVPVDLDSETLEDTITITVAQDYYVDETVQVAVVAPTKVEADAAAADVEFAYSGSVDDDGTDTAAAKEADTEATEEELKARYGAAIVTLPTPETGFTYSWTAETTDEDAAEIEIADNAESVTLDRPDYVETPDENTPQSFSYTLTLTVSDGVHKDATKTFNFTTARVGMRGVPVATTPSFGGSNAEANAAIAADAEITLSGAAGDIDLTWDAATSSFKGENIAPGTYTITIVRPGFLVGSSEIEVQADGTISGEMPEMIAGDTSGDGIINITDVTTIVSFWGTTETKTDINADGQVNITDVTIVVSNWGETGVGTNDLDAE